MSKYDLDDVVVNAKDKREPILFNRYLTRNDKTQVNNLPHREYNTSLKANAERGAKEHALWDKEHPNLASWRDAATAVPFAVASAPLVLDTGQGLMGTALGQAAKHGITAIMGNPYVAGIDDAIGLGFVGKGAYDVSQGKFTPETAMDFMGGARLMYKGLNAWDKASMAKMAARNASRRIVENSELGNNTRRGLEGVDLTRDNILVPETSEVHSPLMPELNSPSSTTLSLPAPAQEEMNIPARLLSDYEDSINMGRESWQTPARNNSFYDNLVADARIQGINDPAIQRLNAMADNSTSTTRSAIDDTELPFDPVTGAVNPRYIPSDPVIVVNSAPSETVISMEGNRAFELSKSRGPLDSRPQQSDYLADNMDKYWDDLWTWERKNKQSLRTRNPDERPYTEEKINSLFNPDGTLIDKEDVANLERGVTGAHGITSWYSFGDSPKNVLTKYLRTLESVEKEQASINKANRLEGKSGIYLKTKDGDTSMDSTPLFYLKMAKGAKHFHPIETGVSTVKSNSFGVKGYFPRAKHPSIQRAKQLLQDNPDADVKLINDAKGNMIALELKDANGVFQIPINSREQVVNKMNSALHSFNTKFDTSYPDITPRRNIFGELGS